MFSLNVKLITVDLDAGPGAVSLNSYIAVLLKEVLTNTPDFMFEQLKINTNFFVSF